MVILNGCEISLVCNQKINKQTTDQHEHEYECDEPGEEPEDSAPNGEPGFPRFVCGVGSQHGEQCQVHPARPTARKYNIYSFNKKN